jgi:hypothetical protein
MKRTDFERARHGDGHIDTMCEAFKGLAENQRHKLFEFFFKSRMRWECVLRVYSWKREGNACFSSIGRGAPCTVTFIDQRELAIVRKTFDSGSIRTEGAHTTVPRTVFEVAATHVGSTGDFSAKRCGSHSVLLSGHLN